MRPEGPASLESANGSRIYISEEAGDTLVVVDGKTMQEIKRIPLSGNPNLVDVTPDGKRNAIERSRSGSC
jgi:YVTN family beta-propeller protein